MPDKDVNGAVIHKDRDWLDLLSKLLLPLVLAVGGGLYTWQKDHADKARVDLDRDTGFIKLLTSTNDRERDFGILIIQARQKKNQFSPDLTPIFEKMAQGKPSDPNTQQAQDILNSIGQNNPAAPTNGSPAPQNKPVEDKSATAVFIQIGSEDQRGDARLLQDKLKQIGYPIPTIELVTNGTFKTYVRYFSHANRDKADAINEAMKTLGFASAVQDFSNGRQLPQLEVWIGTTEKTQLGSVVDPKNLH